MTHCLSLDLDGILQELLQLRANQVSYRALDWYRKVLLTTGWSKTNGELVLRASFYQLMRLTSTNTKYNSTISDDYQKWP